MSSMMEDMRNSGNVKRQKATDKVGIEMNL